MESIGLQKSETPRRKGSPRQTALFSLRLRAFAPLREMFLLVQELFPSFSRHELLPLVGRRGPAFNSYLARPFHPCPLIASRSGSIFPRD